MLPPEQGRSEIGDLGLFKPLPFQLPKHEGKKEMVQAYKDSNGRDRIKGGSDLKSSQSYPKWSFGFKKKPKNQ